MLIRDAITMASAIANSKSPSPILATVRVSDRRVTATSLDHQLDIGVDLPPEVANRAFCVHAARLVKILKCLPEGQELQLDVSVDGELRVIAGPTRFELHTLAAEDFPEIADAHLSDAALTVNTKPLITALKMIAPAMAEADIRFFLNGAHLIVGAGSLQITATDGQRLHRARVPLEPDAKRATVTGIIHRDAVPRILDLAGRHSSIVLDLTPRVLIVDGGGVQAEALVTKLVDGTYPDADRVIPKDRPATAGVAREAFSEAIQRVAQIYTASEGTGVRCTFTRDRITLACTNKEGERATEDFEWNVSGKTFTALEISFQWRFLTDALDALDGQRVHLHLPENTNESLYLTSEDGDQHAVVMPLRD